MRIAFGFALGATLLGLSRSASAQDMGGAGGGAPLSGPSWGTPNVENAPETNQRPTLSRRSVKLFDQSRGTAALELSIGPIWARRVQDETPITQRRNFERGAPLASEIAIGSVFTTPAERGPFYLTGHMKTLLRVIDDKS
ncbi:MAG: hypothetical protein K0S65_3336, partial [Labilithrix sp.]|nr:hypothetical protein [Labilithrix sp.]